MGYSLVGLKGLNPIRLFSERCFGGTKITEFWKTIKPFLTNKGHKAENSLMIMNDNNLVNNPIEVAEIMNSFYINIADKIGNDVDTPGIPIFSDFGTIDTYTTACINYYE